MNNTVIEPDISTVPEGNDSGVKVSAGYLSQNAEQIYYVVYSRPEPIYGSVLLVGPFASERSATYGHLTRWAKFLAGSGFRVMRFDYRGHGESTGQFEEQSLPAWRDDLGSCIDWMRDCYPASPITLHGLRLGALLAESVFRDGAADGLLTWSQPRSGQKMLYDLLRLRLASDLSREGGSKKTRNDYVADLDGGKLVEVDCYQWSRKLWEDSAAFSQMEEAEGEFVVEDGRKRRWKRMQLSALRGNPGRAFDPRTMGKFQLAPPDFSDLFQCSLDWLLETSKAMG